MGPQADRKISKRQKENLPFKKPNHLTFDSPITHPLTTPSSLLTKTSGVSNSTKLPAFNIAILSKSSTVSSLCTTAMTVLPATPL